MPPPPSTLPGASRSSRLNHHHTQFADNGSRVACGIWGEEKGRAVTADRWTREPRAGSQRRPDRAEPSSRHRPTEKSRTRDAVPHSGSDSRPRPPVRRVPSGRWHTGPVPRMGWPALGRGSCPTTVIAQSPKQLDRHPGVGYRGRRAVGVGKHEVSHITHGRTPSTGLRSGRWAECGHGARRPHLHRTARGALRSGNYRRTVWRPAITELASRHPRLAHLRIHDLRHTAASLAISAGGSIMAIQRMLGHKDASMTLDRYGHLYDDDLIDLATKLEAKFLAA